MLKRILLFAAFVVAILPSYLWPYSLSAASAAPNTLIGDKILINHAAFELKLPYTQITLLHTGTPHRGDIVQAHLPHVNGLPIKRVLGLPGETIEIRENHVLINGTPLPQSPLDPKPFAWISPAHKMGSTFWNEDGHTIAYTPGACQYRNLPPLHLGSGEYFLMGDNRDNSLDSRAVGSVNIKQITGKMIWRYWR